MTKNIYFFIGTEAELMKMFHVILEAKNRGYNCKIVSSGQNDIKSSIYLKKIGGVIDIDLSAYSPMKKTACNYLKWFIKTEKFGIKLMKLEKQRSDGAITMVVHGDTLSTILGARIAQKCKIEYMHVESGFRSHNWFSPFPEEIDRYFSSKGAIINFCQKKEATDYARHHFKGKAVNTEYNTGIEILFDALEQIDKDKVPRPITDKYFLAAIHRQENLMNAKFMKQVLEKVISISDSMKCVFIYHVQTEDTLKKIGLWEKFIHSPNIIRIPRLDYVSFINYVINSEFIMADGCGNQQEMYYLGQPYLIMRTAVEENSEGLGENAFCFRGDYSKIDDFVCNYRRYRKERIVPRVLPSKIIVDEMDSYFQPHREMEYNFQNGI